MKKLPDIPDKQTFTLQEVAEVLGVSYTTVYRMTEDYLDSLGIEGLPYALVRDTRRISRKDLVGYLKRKPWQDRQQILPFFDK